jgi:CRISPR-associated protein Cmr4
MEQSNSVNGASALFFLHAQTPLHPGSGTALGFVDQPVQRERHTQWPVIPGSALKGILRDACREKAKVNHGGDRRKANEQDADLTTVFGPGLVDDSMSHAGALTLTDARILAFPVRSLKGVFAWVTCPAVLERLARDAHLVELTVDGLPINIDKANAACNEKSPLLLDDKVLVLEEFEFTRTKGADSLARWIAKMAVRDEQTRTRVQSHLAVIHDDEFTHFVRYATEVSARIGLNYETKTVRPGALFYEEFLPAESLFYSVVLATNSRKKGGGMKAAEVLGYLEKNLPEVLQIGADETIGKGLCTKNLVRVGGKEDE